MTVTEKESQRRREGVGEWRRNRRQQAAEQWPAGGRGVGYSTAAR